MKTDRLNEILMDATDYVEEYEVTKWIDVCSKVVDCTTQKNIHRKYKKLVDKVERGMRAKGIITTEDYEIYGDKVSMMVRAAITSMVWDEFESGISSLQAFQKMYIAGIFDC